MLNDVMTRHDALHSKKAVRKSSHLHSPSGDSDWGHPRLRLGLLSTTDSTGLLCRPLLCRLGNSISCTVLLPLRFPEVACWEGGGPGGLDLLLAGFLPEAALLVGRSVGLDCPAA